MSRRPRSERFRRTRSLKERIRLTLHARGSAEAIARGVALGFFVALTPLFGLHLPVVWLGAILLRANRTAAFLSVFATNAATFVPIFAFTYAVGARILPGRFPPDVRQPLRELAERMRARPFYDLPENFMDMVLSLKDLFWPMMAGGLAVGLVAAALAYPLTLRLVIRVRDRRRKWLAGHPNALRRKEAPPAPGEGPGERKSPPEGGR